MSTFNMRDFNKQITRARIAKGRHATIELFKKRKSPFTNQRFLSKNGEQRKHWKDDWHYAYIQARISARNKQRIKLIEWREYNYEKFCLKSIHPDIPVPTQEEQIHILKSLIE